MFGRSMMAAMPVVVMPMRTVRWSKDKHVEEGIQTAVDVDRAAVRAVGRAVRAD